MQARIIRRAQQKPADGATHWSCRKLSEELGVSKSTVQRILAQAKLRPHRLDRYMASNDPEFEAKAADIIGLYMESATTRSRILCGRKDRDFRRWTDWTRCCRCRQAAPSGTGLNIIDTARCRCMRH
jgi:hypothetical protein